MNNLTTRKIVLGVLMMIVLAFSVQGIAEALTFGTTRTGDLGKVLGGGQFTLSFTLTPHQVAAVDQDGNQIYTFNGTFYSQISGKYFPVNLSTPRSQTQKAPVPTTTPGTIVPTGTTPVAVNDYDDETINIDVSSITDAGGTVRITRGGVNYGIMGGTNQLREQVLSGATHLSSSITLTGTAPTTEGKYIVTVSDQTPGVDLPGGDTANRVRNLSFTIYVVETNLSVRGTTITPMNLSQYGDNSSDLNITFGANGTFDFSGGATNVPITYTVSGGGQVYIRETYGTGVTVSPPSMSSLQTTLETSSAANVSLRMNGVTNRVTVRIPGPNPAATVTYIYGWATLRQVSGNKQDGAVNAQLEDPLVVRLQDSRGTNLDGLWIIFPVVSNVQYLPVTGTVFRTTASGAGTVATDQTPAGTSGAQIQVKTQNGGIASIYLVPTAANAAGSVTPMFDGRGVTDTLGSPDPFTFTATARTLSTLLTKESGDNQSAGVGQPLAEPLVVLVRFGGERREGVTVRFTATTGSLVTTSSTMPNTPALVDSLTINTNARGLAEVDYIVGGTTAGTSVVASIGQGVSRREVRFSVNGGPGSGPSTQQQQQQQQQATNTITISPSSTTGEPGEEVTINVSSSPIGVFATLGSNDFGATRFSPQSEVTPFTSTLLLPVEEGTHSFFATGGTFTAGTASVTVEAELGTLSITALGSPEAGLQTFSISALDADGDRAIGAFTARLSGTGFTTRTAEIAGGRGNARVTLPTTVGTYTLTVSATGYTDGSTTVRVAAGGQTTITTTPPTTTTTTPPADTGGEPDSVSIVGPSTRSGTVNEELDAVLIVRVLDDDGDAVEDARVIFRVRTGQGRLSQRGNGRAIAVQTDSDGYARATYTPMSASSTVEAEARGVTRTVTFTITASGGSAAPTTRDTGTGVTPSTVSPVVHVAAASRPPMLWVDGGAIYALVGADVKEFAPSVDNALNIAVGGGKVYWTEKTGESGGTINSANLNGSGVTELASIFATPMGIAVDVTNSKLYWTNSAGRIQSANLDGSRITNELQNLASPMDIALAGGNAYWTQGGNVRFVNLRGQKVVRNVSTGADAAGSLVIGGGKVYWTEMTGESGGTVNSANLNGTGATQLASILAAPSGIAVDTARSKLYWTNARGRVQSANLDGSKITNVVSGLGSPGELVLSNSIATPTATTTPTTPTTTASKYDLNSDGAVDNADAALVADAMGTSNTKYDVNGDGTVNFLDLLLVFDNRDPGAAGAPTIVGMKLSAAQIDIIEEQIDLLIATNDRSPAAMRVLVYLQQLLVTARPEKTQLLANYPNPFNPETWIPYELATDTNVKITIYNTQGVVIRSLEFGHQSAGYYVGRDRAAYWDGRNALGEQVASGLYFYQLETDEMSLMRKMVILK